MSPTLRNLPPPNFRQTTGERWSWSRAMSDDPTDLYFLTSNDAPPSTPVLLPRSQKAAIDSLALVCLKRSLTPVQKGRLRRPDSFALVIEVPGPSWVAPTAGAIRHYGPWEIVDARDRPDRKHTSDEKNHEIGKP